MIVVRISAAQRQRAEFWAGISRRVLTFVHPQVVHAGDRLELELKLFEDQPALAVSGVAVSCEKRHIDNRDLFRVNLLMDTLSEAVSTELDRLVGENGAQAGAAPPSAPPPPSLVPEPRPSSPASGTSFRAVADALVAERTRRAEAEREAASLKLYVQSLENQLLDVRLSPAAQSAFALEHTPAYGTPAIDPSALAAIDTEREAHAQTARQLEELRSRLQLIEAGAVGTHQALSQQVDQLSRRVNSAEADAAQAQAQTQSLRTESDARIKSLEESLAAAEAAKADLERESGQRQKLLEEQITTASDAATIAGREATERLKAVEAKLAEGAERENAVAEKAAAAGDEKKALEEKLANAAEQERMLEGRLVAADEAIARARSEAAEKHRQIEEQLAQATAGLLAVEKDSAQALQELTTLRPAGERVKVLEAELAALKETSAAETARLGDQLKETEAILAVALTDETAAAAKAKALEEKLAANAAQAAERLSAVEQQLADAQRANETEAVKGQAEAARANAEKAAFTAQAERLRAVEDERTALVRQVATLEGDAGTAQKVGQAELEALRQSTASANEVAAARLRVLEEELAALATRVNTPPPSSAAAAVPAPAEGPSPAAALLEAKVEALTHERDALAARKVELEKEFEKKTRALEASRPAGFALHTTDEAEPEGSSAAMRWLVSFLVSGAIAAAVVAWLTRAH